MDKVVNIVEGKRVIIFKESVTTSSETNINFSELIQDVVNAKNAFKAKKQELNQFMKELTKEEKAEFQSRIDDVLKAD